MKIIAVIVIAILVIGIILALDEEGFENSGYDANYIVFSSTDSVILDTSTDVYEELKETMSSSDAREQLLQMLNNEMEGVNEAVLGVDRYTIFIDFSDGDFAAVDTFEPGEIPDTEGGTGFMIHEGLSNNDHSEENTIHFGYTSGEDGVLSSDDSMVSFDFHDVGGSGKTTCASKQVLILAPAYWETRYPLDENPMVISKTVELLEEYGWSEDDITKTYAYDCPWEVNSDCLLLTPDDFFDLAEYGIVIFVGHGSVRGYKSFTEKNLYLQFCYMTNESFKMNQQFREWKEDKQLIITSKYDNNPGGTVYSTAIRADVLREKLTGTLDSSIYLFPVCYGGFLKDVYLDAGVEVFLGWNNEVDAETADQENMDILTLMLKNNMCAYDAYADGSILKGYNYKNPRELSYDVPIWTGSDPGYKRTEFFIFPEPVGDDRSFNFYLPAWIDLTVTNIPDGTVSVRASVYDAESTLISQSEQEVYSANQIQMEEVGGLFIPEDITVSITVKSYNNKGDELATGETIIPLKPGCSISSVTLSEIGEKPRWVICGSDDTSDLASTKLINGGNVCITPYLNGEKIRVRPNEPQTFSCLDYWAINFQASSGDSLTIKITSSTEPAGVSHYCGELWIYCEDDVSKQMKLYDAMDFGIYEGTETERVLLWEKTYTLP